MNSRLEAAAPAAVGAARGDVGDGPAPGWGDWASGLGLCVAVHVAVVGLLVVASSARLVYRHEGTAP